MPILAAASIESRRGENKTTLGIFPSNIWGRVINHLTAPTDVVHQTGIWTPQEWRSWMQGLETIDALASVCKVLRKHLLRRRMRILLLQRPSDVCKAWVLFTNHPELWQDVNYIYVNPDITQTDWRMTDSQGAMIEDAFAKLNETILENIGENVDLEVWNAEFKLQLDSFSPRRGPEMYHPMPSFNTWDHCLFLLSIFIVQSENLKVLVCKESDCGARGNRAIFDVLPQLWGVLDKDPEDGKLNIVKIHVGHDFQFQEPGLALGAISATIFGLFKEQQMSLKTVTIEYHHLALRSKEIFGLDRIWDHLENAEMESVDELRFTIISHLSVPYSYAAHRWQQRLNYEIESLLIQLFPGLTKLRLDSGGYKSEMELTRQVFKVLRHCKSIERVKMYGYMPPHYGLIKNAPSLRQIITKSNGRPINLSIEDLWQILNPHQGLPWGERARANFFRHLERRELVCVGVDGSYFELVGGDGEIPEVEEVTM